MTPSALNSALPTPGELSPWQRLYGALHAQRAKHWAKRATRLAAPTVSVGNLHWGGGGKTPLVIAIARHLVGRGERVCVLSRGYKRDGGGLVIVSLGEGPLVTASKAGDEPFLIAESVKQAAVVVHTDRGIAGQIAMQELPLRPTVFLLDDGFSHLRVARDFDILAFPNHDPLGGGRLWPGGRLREPLASARRADACILTNAPSDAALRAKRQLELKQALAPFGYRGPVFAATLKSTLNRSNPSPPADTKRPTPTLLVSATANPQSVFQTAMTQGLDIKAHLSFEDHHPYPAATLRKIERRVAETGARSVTTTTKDAVKLRGRLETPLLVLGVKPELLEDFYALLNDRLAQLTSVKT